jgi:toxin YoeB
MFEILYTPKAQNDIAFFKINSPKDYRKCVKFVEEIKIHPRKGTGHPEQLRHTEPDERWSRKINKKDRMVYLIDVEAKTIAITSCRGHYGDK